MEPGSSSGLDTALVSCACVVYALLTQSMSRRHTRTPLSSNSRPRPPGGRCELFLLSFRAASRPETNSQHSTGEAGRNACQGKPRRQKLPPRWKLPGFPPDWWTYGGELLLQVCMVCGRRCLWGEGWYQGVNMPPVAANPIHWEGCTHNVRFYSNCIPRANNRFPLDLDLPCRADRSLIGYDLVHAAGWEP